MFDCCVVVPVVVVEVSVPVVVLVLVEVPVLAVVVWLEVFVVVGWAVDAAWLAAASRAASAACLGVICFGGWLWNRANCGVVRLGICPLPTPKLATDLPRNRARARFGTNAYIGLMCCRSELARCAPGAIR